uniref:Uncharacterized protein n=1 Tax=Cyclophora tenuis TaxID=216820 RepID=A0A7S1DAA8_CYCTE
MVDLLSEVSDDETAELSAGDNSEADDGDETSVGGSVPVDTPAPLQPTISELNDGPPANMYGYSITRRDNGTEEYKDDNEDDGNDEIRELRSRDRYRHTRSVLSDNSLVAERNPRRGLPVSSRNQILESPWEYFMDCFTCSACSAICR